MKAIKFILTFIGILIFKAASAQYLEYEPKKSDLETAPLIKFKVKGEQGEVLTGAVIQKNFRIVAICDTACLIRLDRKGATYRLHLAGYQDTVLYTPQITKEVILKRSAQPLVEYKFKANSEINSLGIFKDNDFLITSTDGTVPGDTVIEKVTQIQIPRTGVLAYFKVFVAGPEIEGYKNFDFVLYEDVKGKIGKPLLEKRITAVLHQSVMNFYIYDEQIILNEGSYFIGYRKSINGFELAGVNANGRRYNTFGRGYIDLKLSNGPITFKKINDKVWEPLLMPKSSVKKVKYYSFSNYAQLIYKN